MMRFTRKQLLETGMTIEKERRGNDGVTFMVLKPGNDHNSDLRAIVRNQRTDPTRFWTVGLYKRDEAHRNFDSWIQ